jgi:hypothetical protein
MVRVYAGRGLHVKTGDSISWTSLSTWMSMLTVISRSALLSLACTWDQPIS